MEYSHPIIQKLLTVAAALQEVWAYSARSFHPFVSKPALVIVPRAKPHDKAVRAVRVQYLRLAAEGMEFWRRFRDRSVADGFIFEVKECRLNGDRFVGDFKSPLLD